MDGMEHTDAYLFGRKTYEELVAYWPTAPSDNPMAQHLNRTPKFVALADTPHKIDARGTGP